MYSLIKLLHVYFGHVCLISSLNVGTGTVLETSFPLRLSALWRTFIKHESNTDSLKFYTDCTVHMQSLAITSWNLLCKFLAKTLHKFPDVTWQVYIFAILLYTTVPYFINYIKYT
jgi:hypothetical protein